MSALSKQGMSSWTRLAQWISSIAVAAASDITGFPSPQAMATDMQIVGRIRAPPGLTA
jgi:hypothetical protein